MVALTASDCGIVQRVIREHFSLIQSPLRDELVSAGHYGLAQAALRFDPDRSSATFHTYAWRRVRGAMQDALRQADHLTRRRRQLVMAGALTDPGPPIALNVEAWADTTPDPADEFQALEDTDTVEYAIRHLTPREQLVVRCVDLHDWPTSEVAHLLGVGPSRVIQIRSGALKRMRAVLSDSLRSAA